MYAMEVQNHEVCELEKVQVSFLKKELFKGHWQWFFKG
jgi:hypothetical protein